MGVDLVANIADHGFWAAPGAVGEYNGKLMNNQYVPRGGTYRNLFPPHTGWQASGLRLVR
jgi:hypothetical protein